VSSALLDVERAPGSLHCPGLSSTRRSLAPCDASSFRRGWDPLQSPSPSLLDRPTSRPDLSSPEVLLPYNGILALAPVWDGLFHSRPGSALRFFQPLSGFSKLEFHGLVSCRNRSWASPCRAFPSQRSCTPLEATGSPAVIHRRAERTSFIVLSPPVSPTPALSTQLPGSPDDYGLPFHEPWPASRSPWTDERSPFIPLASPASKLSSPCESVHTFPGLPRLGGRCSPGFHPLQSSLSDLGASNPPRGQHPRLG
jgi:hypothetical protein